MGVAEPDLFLPLRAQLNWENSPKKTGCEDLLGNWTDKKEPGKDKICWVKRKSHRVREFAGFEIYNVKEAVSRDFLAFFFFINPIHLGPW